MIRYGIVGTGMMGIEHIENINVLEGAEVTAVADTNADSLAEAVKTAATPTQGSVQAFTDHRELIASGACDAVVVATPNFTHVDVVRDLLDTDLHLLIEKPLCTTVADCQSLLDLEAAAGRTDRVVWVGLEYRYMPAVARLIADAASGATGDIHMVSITEHRFPFLVKVDDWNRFRANTGGTLVEKCCHFFDLMMLVMGERPERVYASGGQNVNHLDEVYDGKRSDILDNAYVIVDFPNGRRAMLDLCMFAEATEEQEVVSVIGDEGKLEARLPSGTLVTGRRADHWIGEAEVEIVDDSSIAHVGLHHGSSYVEHVRFCAAIRGEQAVEVTLTDGLWSVAVGAAAHQSISEGRPVNMSEVLG